MTKILDAILDSLKAMNPLWTATFAVISFVVGVFNFFNEIWGYLVAKIATLVLPGNVAASVVSGFGFVDYVFPLSEFFTFFSLWCALFVICAAVRIIKSFVPTIS